MRPLLPLAAALLLTACTASHVPDPAAMLSQPLPAAVAQQATAQQLAALYQTGKVKVAPGGVLVLQLGTGHTAGPATAVSLARAPVAAGPAASTTASPVQRLAPWWGLVLVGALGAAVAVGARRLGRWWAAWRGRVGH